MAFSSHRGGSRCNHGGPNTALLGRTRFSSGHDIAAKSVGTFAATREAARSWLSGRGDTSVQPDPQTRPVGGRPAVGRRGQRDRVSTSDRPKYLIQSNARGRLGTVSKQTAAGPASAASLRLGPRDSNGAFSTFLIFGAVLAGRSQGSRARQHFGTSQTY
jgi:hypothetical protein